MVSNRQAPAGLNHQRTEIKTMIKKTPIAAAFAAALLVSGFAHSGSNVIGSVETDVRVNRASQTQSGLLNKQEARLGSVSDSNVIGSVKTDVRVNRFSQTQSGLLNKQESNIGAVVDSNVIGSVDTDVRVNRLSQTQSGLLNSQKMSIGSVD